MMRDDKEHLFDEYIIHGEASRKQRAENLQIAIVSHLIIVF